MAFITDFVCVACGARKSEAVSSGGITPRICQACCYIERDREKREWFTGREGLTIEERIRDIENFIYEHRNTKHYKEPIRF